MTPEPPNTHTQPTPRPTSRQWTDAQRQAAAERARKNRPWQHSTGPRTRSGKRRSARNSYKHGYFSMEKQVLRWYIRLAAQRVKLLQEHLRQEKEILRNELNARAAKRKAEFEFYKKNARESDRFFDNLQENLEKLRKTPRPDTP